MFTSSHVHGLIIEAVYNGWGHLVFVPERLPGYPLWSSFGLMQALIQHLKA
jgi:hypothetical protein